MIIHKTVYAINPRRVRLSLANLWLSKVIKPKIGRQMRWIVTLEERHRLRDIGPLGETLPPPGVVFGNGMKSRKVVSDEPRRGNVRYIHVFTFITC